MSTLEHFFKSTSDAGSSSSAAGPAFAFLAAKRKTEKVASTGKSSYVTISEELKTKVAKYASENDASALLRHFKSAQELDLKESTVRGWVTTYQKRLNSLRKEGKPRCPRNQAAGPCSLAVNWKSR